MRVGDKSSVNQPEAMEVIYVYALHDDTEENCSSKLICLDIRAQNANKQQQERRENPYFMILGRSDVTSL